MLLSGLGQIEVHAPKEVEIGTDGCLSAAAGIGT